MNDLRRFKIYGEVDCEPLSGILLKFVFILRFPKNQTRLSVGKSCGQEALIRAESEHGGRSKILLGGAFGASKRVF